MVSYICGSLWDTAMIEEYGGFDVLKDIGNKIKNCMEERGVSKGSLCQYTGFSEDSLDSILNGIYDNLTVYDLWIIFNELNYKIAIKLGDI